MNVPYTTRSGLKIGSAYTPVVRHDMPSKDAITLQKSLLNNPITTNVHPVRSCDELGVCKSLTPPLCQLQSQTTRCMGRPVFLVGTEVRMNTIPNPYPNPVTKGYGEMIVEELRTELARLDDIVIKQDVQLRRLTQGIQAIGADLGTIVIAHMQGDSKSVVAQLDGIVNKRVSVAATGSKAVH